MNMRVKKTLIKLAFGIILFTLSLVACVPFVYMFIVSLTNKEMLNI